MSPAASETPAQAAAQAAIAAPPQGAAEALQQAARCAADQLARGRDVPLAVLIDCGQLLALPIGQRPAWRTQGRQPVYERWLERLMAGLRGRWSGNDDRLTLRAAAALVPPRAAPVVDLERLDALDRLAAGDTTLALQGWRGPRLAAGWADALAARPLSGPAPGRPDDLSARLSVRAGGGWLDESLDHEAARQFMCGAIWRPSPQQQARLARLRRAMRTPQWPLTESYEELALYEGAVTASTLALGRYGEFLIANCMDDRLTSPPPVRPPTPVRLRLSRLLGPQSLARRLPAPSPGPGPASAAPGARCAPASVVQALVAWLADDWRSLLTDLPVELVGHRGSADADGVSWPPGPRWQPTNEHASSPPGSMVDRLLRRAGWLDIDPPACRLVGADWWCLVMAQDDVDHFGYALGNARSTTGLPPQVAMLVIVDADEQRGTVFDLLRGGSRGALAWRSPVDPSYAALRARCLDSVLGALEHGS